MAGTANFRVDPRLASLLGENYRSTEHALRELVANAWDADASRVCITLPEPMTNDSIIVADDGCGMTDVELRREYLAIAHDRRSRRGERTPLKYRQVRGRKGIGKFAGLVAAEVMVVATCSGGQRSVLELHKQAFLAAKGDLERIELPLATAPCNAEEHGTTITLSQLSQRLSLPAPEALKELLALEYGRCTDFMITVNDEALSHEDIQGRVFLRTIDMPGVGSVTVRFTVMDGPRGAKHAGIVTRVGGKLIGQPSWFGLEGNDEIPRKLLNRVVGEIEADGLESDVTANGGGLFENSTAYQAVRQWAQDQLKESVGEVFTQEVNLAKARRQKKINDILARLPEHRRPFVAKALDRVLHRFYGESEERIDVLVSLILEALEKDEYWTVCQKIEEARQSDVARFAEALEEFGLLDMAYMAQQAHRRLKFLDDLDALARNDATLEAAMHQALEHNLWVFGPEYSLMASNRTLAQTIKEYTSQKYAGPRAANRPDLFLAQNVLGRYLLIEFKRPSHTISRDDENQAEKYRDDLTPHFDTMDIVVIGGKKGHGVSTQYQRPDIKWMTYDAVTSVARTQLNWLIHELTKSAGAR